jgi:membrane protein insertase Oxa1/YidC/SpoIIIJ
MSNPVHLSIQNQLEANQQAPAEARAFVGFAHSVIFTFFFFFSLGIALVWPIPVSG